MTRSIRVSEAVYVHLLKKMRGGESFDEVLRRLLHLRVEKEAQVRSIPQGGGNGEERRVR